MRARSASRAAGAGLFALRDGFEHPIIGRYLEFARQHEIEIAGFEFIETADGRLVTYDINTTTNYNAAHRGGGAAASAARGRRLPRPASWPREADGATEARRSR